MDVPGSRATGFVSAAVFLILSGCVRPMIEGAQVTELPPGFAYDPNCQSWVGGRMGHPVARQRCWFTHGEPSSSATVTELQGTVSQEELSAYLQGESRSTWRRAEPVEAVRIAGRPAWGWAEHPAGAGKGAESYQAVIPWSGRTYVVHFHGARERDRDPALARRVVHSFRVIEPGSLDPAKLLAAGLLAAGLWVAARRLQRAGRARAPARAGPPTLREREASSPGTELPRKR